MAEFGSHTLTPQMKDTPLEYYSSFVSGKAHLPALTLQGNPLHVEINALDFAKSPSHIDRTRETNSMVVAFEDSGNVAGFVLGAVSQNDQGRTLKVTDMENLNGQHTPGLIRTLLIYLLTTRAIDRIIIPRERSQTAEKMLHHLSEMAAEDAPFTITPPHGETGECYNKTQIKSPLISRNLWQKICG